MATLYISPTGSGLRDGSSWENAGTLEGLSGFIKAAGPGGEVLLRADQGAYRPGVISVAAGGAEGAPVTIRGVDGAGNTLRAEIVGTRGEPWVKGMPDGAEVFRLLSGADHLSFQDMSFRNIGNGAFRISADIQDLTLEHMGAVNVRRFVENIVSGTNTSASCDGLTIRDGTVDGYSKGAIRLQYATRDVLIEDVRGDSGFQDGDNFAIGVHLSGAVQDVVLCRVTMMNALDTVNRYRNGDGFAAEGGVTRVLFEDTVASGNSDAGYDLKSSETVLVRAVAERNNRNFRFWNNSFVTDDCVSLNPVYQGGTGGPAHVWGEWGARVDLVDFRFSDAGALQPLLVLNEGTSTARLVNSPVPDAYKGLVYTANGSTIQHITDVSAPAAPGVALASDTGASATDRITATGALAVTGEAGATVHYSTDGVTWSKTFKPVEGLNTVLVRQSDVALNLSPVTAFTFTLDTTAPASPGFLGLADDRGGARVAIAPGGATGDATPVLSGTAEAGAAVRVVITRPGAPDIALETLADGEGRWSATAPTLAEGVHTVASVRVTDAAGNATTALIGTAFTLDTKAPAAPVMALSAASDSGASSSDRITNVTEPILTGTAEAGSRVTLAANGATVGSAIAAGDGSWSIKAAALPHGVHALTALATDAAGNASPASAPLLLTVDTSADTFVFAKGEAAGDRVGDFARGRDRVPGLRRGLDADAGRGQRHALDDPRRRGRHHGGDLVHERVLHRPERLLLRLSPRDGRGRLR